MISPSLVSMENMPVGDGLFYLMGKFVLCGARIALRFLERRDSQSPLFRGMLFPDTDYKTKQQDKMCILRK